MSRKNGKSVPREKETDGLAAAVILFICFCAAGVVGCLAVSGTDGQGVSALSDYLENYLALLVSGNAASPSVWSVAWELCRWPFLAFVLGFTALGIVALPAAFLCRGFLLGYAAAAFIKVFGSRGILLSGTVFGMTALVSVPVFFFVGALAFRRALRLAAGALRDRNARVFQPEQLLSLVPCGIFLLTAVLCQWALIPQLLAVVSGSFL